MDALSRYLVRLKPKKTTWYVYKNVLTKFFNEINRKPDDFLKLAKENPHEAKFIVEAYLAEMLADEKAPNYVLLVKRIIQGFLQYYEINIRIDVNLRGSNKNLDYIPSKEEVETLFEELSKLRHLRCMARLSDVRLAYAYQYLKGDVKREPHCYMAFMEVFIDSQGNVLSGCNVLPPTGNIFQNSLKDIFASERYKKRSRIMLARKCPGCTCGYGINQIIENLPTYGLSQLRERRRLLPL